MQTQLIEIVPDTIAAEESWSDWATRGVKENGWKVAGAAVVAAPVIPVGLGAIALGAGLVSGVQHGVAWLRGSETIEQIQLSKVTSLRDEHGLPLKLNQVYAMHPNNAHSNIAVLASEFHNMVVSEQIADLVLFIRSVVRASTINIKIESERSGKAGLSFLARLSFNTEGGVAKHHSVELQYDDPEIIELSEDPFWLRLFPEVEAAFKGAKRGSIKRSVSVDTTFGLNASLAEQAGIDLDWIGRQKFNIEAKFL